ncbi:MAG: 3-hydroxyacyl-[acyl-carrier-protein] dehydratase FabZ [Gammaproteobacteria bacterium]|nr:3-hydroxyacyl-[acyl-carrier-protein] dehydratase FabZ [Gammaproteobacteria bacterium]RPG25552.1 MAG: 3-hydroxyacyl-ACP dehydratase FabZ [Gammaproteobacteria bacterium TMED57]
MKTITELFEYLPHRYPFLLIDRVTETVVGERIKGYKNITANEELFNGHFPGQPIFPGVLILEAMAQLSGVLAFETKGVRPADGTNYLFGGVEKARFRRQVIPGDRLDLESTIVAERKIMMKFECAAFVDGEIACSAVLTVVEQSA